MKAIEIKNIEKTWMTSDHHFGHENIIRFTNRPFDTVQEMDQSLIDNWNEIVGKDDSVFHLGDLTLGGMSDARKYLNQLNGKIYILGNHWHHDKRWLPGNSAGAIPGAPHARVIDPLVVLEIPDLPMNNRGYPLAVTLCHYPMAVWDRKHYGAWHLHGHSHGQFKYTGDLAGDFALDVGVDAMNYCPIKLGNVVTLMHERGW